MACQAVHYEDQRSSFNKGDYDSARDPRAAGNLPDSIRTRYDLLGSCIHDASSVCILITTTSQSLRGLYPFVRTISIAIL